MAVGLSASFYLFSAFYCSTLWASEGLHQWDCKLGVCFWVARNSFLLLIAYLGDWSLKEMWIMFSLNMYWPCNPMSSAKSLRWWSGRILVSESGKVGFTCFFNEGFCTFLRSTGNIGWSFVKKKKTTKGRLFHGFPSPTVQIEGKTILKN